MCGEPPYFGGVNLCLFDSSFYLGMHYCYTEVFQKVSHKLLDLIELFLRYTATSIQHKHKVDHLTSIFSYPASFQLYVLC